MFLTTTVRHVFWVCLFWSYNDISTILSDIGCNYVKFDATVEFGILSYTIGTFSLSTNRCQSLKAAINWGPIDTIDGGLKFSCNSNGNGLQLEIYDDPTCSDSAILPTSLLKNESLTLFTYVKLKIDELHCDYINCDVGFTFAKNCSWLDSQVYLNVSLPPEQCLSLGADFDGLLSDIPDEIMPEEIVSELQTSSMKYSCCDDNSLLIYNYSDTTCGDNYNMIRVKSEYNGTCFQLNNDESFFSFDDIINSKRRSMRSLLTSNKINDLNNYASNSDNSDWKFVLQWSCATQASCDAMNVDFIDDDYFPSQCSDSCLNGLNWDSSGSSGKTNGGDPLVSKSGISKQGIIGICITGIIIFVICIIGVYYVTRKRRIKREIDRQNDMILNDERYAPMIEGNDREDSDVGIKTEIKYDNETKNSIAGNNKINNNKTHTTGFASITASMTIDNVVQQDIESDNSDENNKNNKNNDHVAGEALLDNDNNNDIDNDNDDNDINIPEIEPMSEQIDGAPINEDNLNMSNGVHDVSNGNGHHDGSENVNVANPNDNNNVEDDGI